jgi:hypothetical protein
MWLLSIDAKKVGKQEAAQFQRMDTKIIIFLNLFFDIYPHSRT